MSSSKFTDFKTRTHCQLAKTRSPHAQGCPDAAHCAPRRRPEDIWRCAQTRVRCKGRIDIQMWCVYKLRRRDLDHTPTLSHAGRMKFILVRRNFILQIVQKLCPRIWVFGKKIIVHFFFGKFFSYPNDSPNGAVVECCLFYIFLFLYTE